MFYYVKSYKQAAQMNGTHYHYFEVDCETWSWMLILALAMRT